MNKTGQTIKVAILTTPGGIFTVHYLVKKLNVVGIIIDRGQNRGHSNKMTAWQKIESIKRTSGWKEVFSAAVNKACSYIGSKPLFIDEISKMINIQYQYSIKMDDMLFGYNYYQKRLEYRDFIKWSDLADYYKIPVEYVDSINDKSSAGLLRKWDIDLGIIAGGRIIKPDIIRIPRLGFINKHPSILPKHRGAAAHYWCLYYEDFDSLGITVHYVDSGMDSGNIIIQKRMKFEKGDTPATLRFKSDIIGREALVEAVRAIETTGTKGSPQDAVLATRNKRPTMETDKELYSELARLWERYAK